MSIFTLFKTKAAPTTSSDYIAYSQGAQAQASTTYNTYVESVEAVDKSIRIIANIASMAKFEVFQEQVSGKLKPYKIKNIDFKYNTNEQDSQHDLISMIFSSIFTQGSAILLTADNKSSKMKNFYSYDVSRFKVYPTENNLLDSFEYTSESGQLINFKRNQVIYIAPRLSSSNLIYAVSKLKPLADLLTVQADIIRHTQEYYGAGGKDSAIISPKEPMSTEKATQLKTAFDSFLQTPATKTLFINTEVDVKSVSSAQSPTQIMEALTKINGLIIEQFGIPPYLYGNYNGYVNDAAVVTACRLFFQVHLLPVFKSIEYQFTRYFREALKLTNAVVKFNYEDIEILKDNLDGKIEQSSKMYKLGLISMNEAREICELEKLNTSAADMHMLPAYLVSDKPIAIENYEEAMANLMTSTGSTPIGSTGGSDNANLINDSTGGAGNIGE